MTDFLTEHATTLLALLTLVSAFGGAVLGAKIQANGGRAQALAAQKAAETAAAAALQAVREQTDRAAAASHAAAVRDERMGAIADLLRTVREFTRTLDQLYSEPDEASVDAAYGHFFQARSAVELLAPTALTATFTRVLVTAENLAALARKRAEAKRASERLSRLSYQFEGQAEEARLALELLAALRTAAVAGEDEAGPFRLAHGALCLVSGLTSAEQLALVFDHKRPALEPVLAQHREEHSEAMAAFITQARIVLGVVN
ncbi:hypothetical protein [Streptomyces sp. NPDC001717]|uniref:hypothetical protein n=1 Tax=Streptomyces sp. NPDC001717 TaxID=3364604 RepID=UPI0036A74E0B